MNHQMVALHHGDFHKLLVDVEVELHLMEEFVGGDFYQTTTTTTVFSKYVKNAIPTEQGFGGQWGWGKGVNIF